MPDPTDQYDIVAYPSHPLPQTHPSRLAAIAALHGMDPAPPDRGRVLELGCGDGTNLIALAAAYPHGTFVGLDRAATAVETGNKLIRAVGLTNVTLHVADLMTFDPAPHGPFDYVVTHGCYSWVPPPVRDKLLAVTAAALAPQGIGYVSYNTYPGCYIRRMLWEMMRFHTRAFDDPVEKIEQARSFMQFLGDGQMRTGAYEELMTEELKRLAYEQNLAVLYHDDLAEVNDPVYFTEFAAHARRHGLQFLGEADYFESTTRHLKPAVRERLSELEATDVVLKEQYLDFLKFRRFRQTLVCREAVARRREPDASRVKTLFASAALKTEPAEPDLGPGVPVQFQGPSGTKLTINLPLAKAALAHLSAAHPAAVGFDALAAAASARLRNKGLDGGEADRDGLADVLLTAFSVGMIELFAQPLPAATAAGDRPVVSPLTRHMLARNYETVPSLRHSVVRVDNPLSRQLLLLLDGTRDRAALLNDLVAWAVEHPPEGSDPAARPTAADLHQMLDPQIDSGIGMAVQTGVLVG